MEVFNRIVKCSECAILSRSSFEETSLGDSGLLDCPPVLEKSRPVTRFCSLCPILGVFAALGIWHLALQRLVASVSAGELG